MKKEDLSKNRGTIAKSGTSDTFNEPLGRGTRLRLHLREEAGEYLEESKLKELVKKYSKFINFPIYLWAVDVEVPADEDDSGDESKLQRSKRKKKEDSDKEEDE
ncbi:endoplasmin [Tanacetum coccineum]